MKKVYATLYQYITAAEILKKNAHLIERVEQQQKRLLAYYVDHVSINYEKSVTMEASRSVQSSCRFFLKKSGYEAFVKI
jgi:hypothetical protein